MMLLAYLIVHLISAIIGAILLTSAFRLINWIGIQLDFQYQYKD